MNNKQHAIEKTTDLKVTAYDRFLILQALQGERRAWINNIGADNVTRMGRIEAYNRLIEQLADFAEVE